MRTSNPRSIAPSVYPVATWLLRTAFGYALLFLVSLWFPVAGLHRIAMGRLQGWWRWPASSIALIAGGVAWIAAERHAVGIVALLCGGSWFFRLWISDFLTMWAWQWPFSWSLTRQHVEAIEQRLNLRTNLSLLVFLAVAMWFIARVW